MHISVRYTPELRQSVRLNLYLHRKLIGAFALCGALAIIYGVAYLAGIVIALGVLLLLEIPVLLSLRIYRNREVFLGEVELTITSEGIERRSGGVAVNVTWDKLKRIHELNDMWIFVANRLTRFGVAKRVLSQDQQAELAAFIAARGA